MCIEAIRENVVTIDRQRGRVRMVEREVERRGMGRVCGGGEGAEGGVNGVAGGDSGSAGAGAEGGVTGAAGGSAGEGAGGVNGSADRRGENTGEPQQEEEEEEGVYL